MPSKRISQRAARLLKARVKELEEKYKDWADHAYPCGINLHCVIPSEMTKTVVNTARSLGHPVFAVIRDNTLYYYGGKI